MVRRALVRRCARDPSGARQRCEGVERRHTASFIAALFAGGSSVSIVGSGALEPDTETFRLFYFFTALAGTAVTSLVLTYLMQVYSALLRRHTVALDIDTWSGQTGDAVVSTERIGHARSTP